MPPVRLSQLKGSHVSPETSNKAVDTMGNDVPSLSDSSLSVKQTIVMQSVSSVSIPKPPSVGAREHKRSACMPIYDNTLERLSI